MDRRSLVVLGGAAFGLGVVFPCLTGAAQATKETPGPPPPRGEDEGPRTTVDAPVDPARFAIGPEDILSVRVWREPELSGTIVVRPDGRISLPLMGDLEAGGLTPDKLRGRITEGLSKYISNPNVAVSVLTVNSKTYFVSGEVTRSGSYPLVVPTTIMEAIAIAGGFREYADKKSVLIQRGPKRLKFNYKDYIRGKNPSDNILLEPRDHIIVP